MKNLRKIIVLFIAIFIAGIAVTIITVNSSLNKTDAPTEALEIKRDTTSLLKAEKEIERL